MSTATLTRSKAKTPDGTMTAAELNAAIDQCGSVFIGVRFETEDGGVSFLRWRDKSFAIRRKIRALARDALKQHPEARFNARIADTGGIEKTLIVGS